MKPRIHLLLLCQLVLFSTTALSFYTSGSSEELEPFSDKVQFYYSRGSYHATNVGNGSFSCIKIAKYKDGRRWSDAVDGGRCVLLYARGDCSGRTLVAPPGYPSSFVYDDVGSFSPCPPPKFGDVSIYAETGLNGLMARYTGVNECSTLPTRVAGRARSVHTHGSCVRLYEHRGCKGQMLEMKPDSLYHWDLARFDFGNKTHSISGCAVCTGFKLQAKILRVKFTNSLKDDMLKGEQLKVDMAWTNSFLNNATSQIKKSYSDVRSYRETFRFEKITSLSSLHRVEMGRDFTVESGFGHTEEGTKSTNVYMSNTHLEENVGEKSGQKSAINISGMLTDKGSAVAANQQIHQTVGHGATSGTNTYSGTMTGKHRSSSRTQGADTEDGETRESGSSQTNEQSTSSGEFSKHNAGASANVGVSVPIKMVLVSAGLGAHYDYEKGYARSSESRSATNSYNSRTSHNNRRTHSSTQDSEGTYGESQTGSGSSNSNSINSEAGSTSGFQTSSSLNSQNSQTSQAGSLSAFNNQNRKMTSSQNTISALSQLRNVKNFHGSHINRVTSNMGGHTVDDTSDGAEHVREVYREFAIQEEFTIQPCVVLEMHAYILEQKDMPLEFDMEVEFSEEEGCLNDEQLRAHLPQGMEYVRPLNEFAILAKTRGRIIAKLGVKTEVEIHESAIPECQSRL